MSDVKSSASPRRRKFTPRIWKTSPARCAPPAARCRWWRTSISSRTPRSKPRSGWRKSASIRETMPTRRSSRSANTATRNMRRNSNASARSSRRWFMLCKDLGRAMRIGTNHGSLSDRIMNRYGDTPLGMVESALEFARIARENDYHALVFSMKASNPKVMIEAYRLLVARLHAEGPDWNYPIHLGVTEAGDGEDGRIKSAIGIGSLLADGIGDTDPRFAHRRLGARNPRGAGAGGAVQSERWLGRSVPVRRRDNLSRLNSLAHTIRPDWSQLEKRTSTYLPHWRIPGATYAVTFRIKDSLPASVLKEYEREKSILLEQHRHGETTRRFPRRHRLASEIACGDPRAHRDRHRTRSARRGRASTAGGSRDRRHGGAGAETLRRRTLRPARLVGDAQPCACAAHSAEGHELEKILQSWKSHTAKEANRMLGKSGTFWQEEYYDHIVRDGEDLKHQVRYILRNPGKGRASAEWTGSVYGVVGTGCPNHGLGAGCSSHIPSRPPTIRFPTRGVVVRRSRSWATRSAARTPCGCSPRRTAGTRWRTRSPRWAISSRRSFSKNPVWWRSIRMTMRRWLR